MNMRSKINDIYLNSVTLYMEIVQMNHVRKNHLGVHKNFLSLWYSVQELRVKEINPLKVRERENIMHVYS